MARVVLALRADKGGAFNHVVQISDALVARGHEVFLAGPHAAKQEEIAATVVPLEIARSISPVGDLKAIGSFGKLVRKLRPDIVHAHGSKAGVVARVARLATPRTPVVFTPNLYAFDNHFARPGERRAYRAIERVLAPAASRVIGACENERRLAAQVGPASRTRTVHNGVDAISLANVHPKVAELSEQGPVIVTVAELRESKGVVTLIEAMNQVQAKMPEARLAIAGDGADRARVERRVRDLGLSDKVFLLGATQGADAVLAGADVFVNAAYAEGFPYTVIEAMSASLPIVATDVGGTREAIKDGETGFLAKAGDPESLARPILRVSRGSGAGKAHRERSSQSPCGALYEGVDDQWRPRRLRGAGSRLCRALVRLKRANAEKPCASSKRGIQHPSRTLMDVCPNQGGFLRRSLAKARSGCYGGIRSTNSSRIELAASGAHAGVGRWCRHRSCGHERVAPGLRPHPRLDARARKRDVGGH